MTETEYLEELFALEDLAEKKTKIYGRLLMEQSFAKQMEELSLRHAERKSALEKLLYGEIKKSKERGQVRDEAE